MTTQKKLEIITDTPVDSVYDFLKVLGTGSYSGVVLAQNKANQEKVAIKIIDKRKLTFKETERLRRELEINAQLSHENIVVQREVYQSRIDCSIVMELMSGGDLFSRISDDGPLTEDQARKPMKEVFSAIAYLHSLSIAHRDLKPENLVFENNSVNAKLKIIDFGFAKKFSKYRPLETPLGSPGYAPPDLRQEKYTVAVDMWSLGCVLYFTFFGIPPFYHDDEDEMSQLVMEGKFSYPKDIPVSEDAKDLINKMLTKNASERITAEEALKHPWFAKPEVPAIATTTIVDVNSITKSPPSSTLPSTVPMLSTISPATGLVTVTTIIPIVGANEPQSVSLAPPSPTHKSPSSLAVSKRTTEEKNKLRQTLNKTVEVHREQDNKIPFVLIPAEQSSLWKSRMENQKQQ